ncbi:Sorting nexin mvp1 [Coemansia guatemalensis]|uniref:Sorting nexin MVP1 n=1 Tax=Coemansia guatemalensis TaxID=2761395 RepID=A0A9W8HTP9_9FUNG|nr:Sorting nexin mvp1 [Coemansia guatemalensis]
MSDLYDILDPWGPSNGSTTGGATAAIVPGIEESSRRCLDNVALPPVYAAAHAAALRAGDGRVTRDVLLQTLEFSNLPRHVIGQIVLAADTGAGSLTKQDFNLALAMTALAQKNMSPSLESVMFHKDDLPEPVLDGIEELAGSRANGSQPQSPTGALEVSDDPWLNTAKGPGDLAASTAALGSMSLADNRNADESKEAHQQQKQQQQRNSADGNTSAQTFVPNINMEAMQWQLDMEDVSIREAAEKGGIVFKHTNYEVSTRSFSSMVVRRYNDFFWISNYLIKRYPYRMHPNIPPKGFPDNRIKGLTRFSSAILRTPFLRRDALVIQFFTNTDEFSHVVKVGNLDMDAEEIEPEEELDSTPWAEVQQTYVAFDDFYGLVARDEEKYRTQITSLEKIARYKQAIGDELYTYSDTLRVANAPRECISGSLKYYMQPPAKRALDSGLNELCMSFGDASLLEKSHGEVLKTISAEYLRRLYDVVVSMKLMMDRMRQMDKQRDIQRIRERSDTSRKQLALLSGGDAPGASGDRSSIERLERLVREDTAELERLEHEQRCIELRFYHELARYRCYECFLQTHYHGIVEEQIKHHTLALNAWRQALATADELPSNPLDFIS